MTLWGTPIRAPAAVFFAALLWACTGRPPCSNGTILSGPPGRAAFFRVGETYSATVSVGAACATSTPSVTGTVLDPNGDVVTSQWSFDTATALATVTFTPMANGPHAFVVRFEPNLGLAQGTFFPATRSTRQPVRELVLPEQLGGYCLTPHLLPGGALVCGTGDSLSTLFIPQDGGFVQTLPRLGEPVFSGKVMWARGSDRMSIERWEEREQGLVLTHTLPSTGGGVVAGNETLVFESGSPGRFYRALPDGGMSAPGVLSYGLAPPSGAGRMTADGGAFWSVGFETCLNSLDTVTRECFASVSAGRADVEGVWAPGLVAGAFGATALLLQRDDGSSVSAPIPSRELGTWPVAWLSVPPFDVALAVPVAGGFRYETFAEGFTSGDVDGEWLLLFAPGKAVVFAR